LRRFFYVAFIFLCCTIIQKWWSQVWKLSNISPPPPHYSMSIPVSPLLAMYVLYFITFPSSFHILQHNWNRGIIWLALHSWIYRNNEGVTTCFPNGFISSPGTSKKIYVDAVYSGHNAICNLIWIFIPKLKAYGFQ
jgi:hypothetical protein